MVTIVSRWRATDREKKKKEAGGRRMGLPRLIQIVLVFFFLQVLKRLLRPCPPFPLPCSSFPPPSSIRHSSSTSPGLPPSPPPAPTSVIARGRNGLPPISAGKLLKKLFSVRRRRREKIFPLWVCLSPSTTISPKSVSGHSAKVGERQDCAPMLRE